MDNAAMNNPVGELACMDAHMCLSTGIFTEE